MKILDDLIATIESAVIKEVCIGVFTTAVVSRQCGLASTLSPQYHDHSERINESGDLIGRDVQEIAQKIKSSYLLEASLGMACINSGLNLNKIKLVDINAEEIIQEKGKDKNVAIIGHFPFVDRIRNHVKNLYVFEKHPQKGDIPTDRMQEILSDVSVLAMTGTCLTNHTFQEIMNHANKDAFKIMLGPSTPLSRIMFDYGLDILCGVAVEDKHLVMKYIKQGSTFQYLRGKRMVMMRKE